MVMIWEQTKGLNKECRNLQVDELQNL